MNVDVSVVIPAYRSARFIAEALRSVFAQTCAPREIIVVDDHSPDETCAVVESLIAESPVELRLIRRETNSGGPVGPMNAGVDAARGPLIAMLDHDDRMLPTRIAATLPLMASDAGAGIVFNRFTFFDENRDEFTMFESRYDHLGETAKVFPARQAFDDLVLRGFPYGGAGGMLFRKEAWRAIGGFRECFRIVWDYDFGLRTTSAGWNVGYLPESHYQHRLHADNLESSGGGLRNSREHLDLYWELSRRSDLDDAQRALKNARPQVRFSIGRLRWFCYAVIRKLRVSIGKRSAIDVRPNERCGDCCAFRTAMPATAWACRTKEKLFQGRRLPRHEANRTDRSIEILESPACRHRLIRRNNSSSATAFRKRNVRPGSDVSWNCCDRFKHMVR
ncbi:MAG: glycosyltransferase family A protein [Pirellulales bacterium]